MNSIWDGKTFLLDHMEHLVREVEHLRTLIKEHDSGGIYTTIAMLEFRIKQLRENLDRL
jgi:hypothetical protein|tara:strand:- start:219 stop:395 length:177 start_codon:yes stop_codon:yes gene_type:complete